MAHTKPIPNTTDAADSKDFGFFQELNMQFLRMMGEMMLVPEDDPGPIAKLSHSQGKVLLYLALRGPQRMSAIARLLSISLPSATPIIDALVEMKMVKRRQDLNDRRVVLIELSAAGNRFHEQMNRHHAKKLKQVFAHLTEEEQQEVLNSLRRIVSLMKKGEET